MKSLIAWAGMAATVVLVSTCDALPADLSLEPITTAAFSSPIGVRSPNDGTHRLFVFERGCTSGSGNANIWIVKDGVKLPTPFLTVPVSCNIEQGLLGLEFHPQYASNGYFYVAYTMPPGCGGTCLGAAPDQVLARFHVSPDADVADAASKLDILHIPDIDGGHNAGDLHFGPDGYLYWSMGDGGLQPDPQGFAQCNKKKLADNETITCGTIPPNNTAPLYYLLGKLMRLDVDHTTAAATSDMCGVALGQPANYALPSGNPFVGQAGFCGEIWSTGLRNPFRFSFDRLTGDLFLGDVGYQTTEEIDFQAAATSAAVPYNYGWRNCEGRHPRGTTGGGCSTGIFPILEYFHVTGSPIGCAVIGGYRFRGPIQPLQGTYLFSDFCTGGLFYSTQSGTWTFARLALPGGELAQPQGFGEDTDGNVYVASAGDGKVYKITSDFIFANGVE